MMSDTKTSTDAQYASDLRPLAREIGGETEWDGRIGDTMQHVVNYVDRNGPAQSMHVVAKSVGPHGSTQYGYPPVHRARRRGLIDIVPDHPEATPGSAGAVCLTLRGLAYAEYLSNEGDSL